MIISTANTYLASFQFYYKLVEQTPLWRYGMFVALFVVFMVVCVAILIYIPLSIMAKGHVTETA